MILKYESFINKYNVYNKICKRKNKLGQSINDNIICVYGSYVAQKDTLYDK